jgi:hypothetical protein
MEKMGKEYKLRIGKPEGKGTLARLRHRWKDNNSLKCNLKK